MSADHIARGQKNHELYQNERDVLYGLIGFPKSVLEHKRTVLKTSSEICANQSPSSILTKALVWTFPQKPSKGNPGT